MGAVKAIMREHQDAGLHAAAVRVWQAVHRGGGPARLEEAIAWLIERELERYALECLSAEMEPPEVLKEAGFVGD